MLDPPPSNFTDFDSWHPSRWSPVYDRVTSRLHLVGFTPLLRCGLDRLVIRQETGDELGTFVIVGEARGAQAGAFHGRVFESGAYRALPGSWALYGSSETRLKQPRAPPKRPTPLCPHGSRRALSRLRRHRAVSRRRFIAGPSRWYWVAETHADWGNKLFYFATVAEA